jgi:hypothetical protein
MFGLEYIISLMKISIDIGFAIITAIPTYYAWNCIAPIYFSFLADKYQNIPYWHIVSLFLICTYLGEQIEKIIPKLISIKNVTEIKTKEEKKEKKSNEQPK